MGEPPGIGILGTGGYLPDEVVSNATVADRAGVTADWIVRKTGIHNRRYAAEHEATSDLAVRAAEAALAAAGVRAEQLGWVVVATSTPDHPQPPTACLVQDRIGAEQAGAFDVNAVCAGFVYALTTVSGLLAMDRTGPPGYGLVIGADVYSRIIDRSERRTAVLFGDGAGAVVVGPVAPGRGIVATHMASRGDQRDLIRVRAGGSRLPTSEKTVADGLHYFEMDGRGVREFVLTELPRTVAEVLERGGVRADRVDHFVPHQANGVLLEQAFPRLGLARARMHLTVGEQGNTSAASIPLALDAASRSGALRDGELVLLAGFGGGMALGAVLLDWEAAAARV